jgi:ATP-dependent DNA ligase
MNQFLQDIIDMGGEGIILRDPLSPHQPGRSSGFLKHKVRYFVLFSFLIFQSIVFVFVFVFFF